MVRQMSIKVFLVQHGKARDKSVDPERHLTDEGKQITEKVASFLSKSNQVQVTSIYHSDKMRSRETAEILAQHLNPSKGLIQDHHLNPLDDPTAWLQKLENITETVMLVGHLPHLSRLAAILITRRPEDEIVKFQYSGVLCLEQKNEENMWTIKWFLIPELLP